MVQRVGDYFGMLRKDGMDRSPQIADPFPMNDPDLGNPAILASRQVIGDQILQLARFEGVQVQHAVDR